MALDSDAAAVGACHAVARALGLTTIEVALLDGAAPLPPGLAADVAGSLFTLPHRPGAAALLAAAALGLRPGGRLAAAVWSAPDAVPPIDALLAASDAVIGIRPPTLEAALSLGAPGALETLAAEAGMRGVRVDRLRDVVRFHGLEHLLAAISSAYDLGFQVDTLEDATLAGLLEALSQRLLPWTAGDGTLAVPVEAAVLVYPVTGVE